MKHIVKYLESERGWGGEVWYSEYDTEAIAIKEVGLCNKDLPMDSVPDYYIVAEYIGEWPTTPIGYKF